MQVLTAIAPTREALRQMRRNGARPGATPEARLGATLGLVPTMGALHRGHLELVRAARAGCDRVAVSLFVNPLQFGPAEDLDRYPRTFAADCALLEAEGVDLLFAPTAEEMYPVPSRTLVDVPGIGGRLDGASRPGHFRGVATVVSKLFGIVGPDRAFFGQKDAAQVAVLRAMVEDLNLPVELVVCPTVRDPDGLALSSRNRFLSAAERARALSIPRALQAVEQAVASGWQEPSRLGALLVETLRPADDLRLDYAALVHPDTLEPVEDLRRGALVAVAAWVGGTRLIDNLLLPARGAV